MEKNNPFGVQLESQITVSSFFSSNGASFVQKSRHGGPETAELLNPCVSAIAVCKKIRMSLLEVGGYLDIEVVA